MEWICALSLSDYACVIDQGRTPLPGTDAELLTDLRVREAYRGDGVSS